MGGDLLGVSWSCYLQTQGGSVALLRLSLDSILGPRAESCPGGASRRLEGRGQARCLLQASPPSSCWTRRGK